VCCVGVGSVGSDVCVRVNVVCRVMVDYVGVGVGVGGASDSDVDVVISDGFDYIVDAAGGAANVVVSGFDVVGGVGVVVDGVGAGVGVCRWC